LVRANLATKTEVEEHWTIADVWEAHELLDIERESQEWHEKHPKK